MNRVGKRAVLLAIAASAAACSSSGTGNDGASRPSFVIVHGAWMDASGWGDGATGLRAKGADVEVVELPAHGADTTPLQGATLDAYTATVQGVVDAAGRPVVLVGHSMAGVVIARRGGQPHERGQARVRERLCSEGRTELARPRAARSRLASGGGAAAQARSRNRGASCRQALGHLCADCNPGETQSLTTHYRDEPLAPFATPVRLAASFGAAKKVYVYTKQDHAISYAYQQAMTSRLDLAATATVDSSHCPFLSNVGDTVATLWAQRGSGPASSGSRATTRGTPGAASGARPTIHDRHARAALSTPVQRDDSPNLESVRRHFRSVRPRFLSGRPPKSAIRRRASGIRTPASCQVSGEWSGNRANALRNRAAPVRDGANAPQNRATAQENLTNGRMAPAVGRAHGA